MPPLDNHHLNDMQPNHAIDHSKSKIQEFSEQLSAANPFCALGCLGQVCPGGRAMGGAGGQVCSLQPTCLSAGPQGAARAVLLLLLPTAAASHCCLPQSNQLSSPANYGG